MQDHIFVLLMQTGTSVAKVLQFFTRKPYNHASVALDLTLEEMYSFCRNHIHFPLPAGFNQEIVGEGTLGRFLVIPCEIYAIPVTKEKKQEFEQNLAYAQNLSVHLFLLLLQPFKSPLTSLLGYCRHKGGNQNGKYDSGVLRPVDVFHGEQQVYTHSNK